MKLDAVTTIAIGDIDARGKRIAPHLFNGIARHIADAVTARGGTVYAVTFGAGVTSDQPDETTERSAVILCGNVADLPNLRADVAAFLRVIGGSSACFATDPAHEPAFATVDGWR